MTVTFQAQIEEIIRPDDQKLRELHRRWLEFIDKMANEGMYVREQMYIDGKSYNGEPL